jgi:acyl carrier protein
MASPTFEPAVKQFVLDHFLAGEDPAHLTPTTPLITGGIIDSLGLLDLVMFLEQQFHVEFEAHEIEPAQFDTLAGIDALLQRKGAKPAT